MNRSGRRNFGRLPQTFRADYKWKVKGLRVGSLLATMRHLIGIGPSPLPWGQKFFESVSLCQSQTYDGCTVTLSELKKSRHAFVIEAKIHIDGDRAKEAVARYRQQGWMYPDVRFIAHDDVGNQYHILPGYRTGAIRDFELAICFGPRIHRKARVLTLILLGVDWKVQDQDVAHMDLPEEWKFVIPLKGKFAQAELPDSNRDML